MTYADAVERKVPGRHSSDNIVLIVKEGYFISKIPPPEKKLKPQRCVLFVKSAGRGRTLSNKAQLLN